MAFHVHWRNKATGKNWQTSSPKFLLSNFNYTYATKQQAFWKQQILDRVIQMQQVNWYFKRQILQKFYYGVSSILTQHSNKQQLKDKLSKIPFIEFHLHWCNKATNILETGLYKCKKSTDEILPVNWGSCQLFANPD